MLSVILVNYNTGRLLVDCVRSVLETVKSTSVEIVVVDNASTRELEELDHLVATCPVLLVRSERNLGFPAANNLALLRCLGDFVLLLNPDTIVLPGSIDGLLRFLEHTPRAGIIGPRLLNMDGSLQRSVLQNLSLVRLLSQRLRLRPLKNPCAASHPQKVDGVIGACLLIRRETLTSVGHLDTALFWIEDLDWCCRSRNRGWDVYYVPEFKVVHYGGASAATDIRIALRRQYLNKIAFFSKYRPGLELVLLKAFLLAEIAAKCVVRLLGIPRRPRDWRERLLAYGDVARAIFSGANW
jgi:GT2 family glycosyltransferase